MDSSNWITNNISTLEATRQYFYRGGAPSCKAGLRWLVVTSDGALQPCSMQFKRYGLHEQARMVREFTQNNTCDECYVSIRSYLDKIFSAVAARKCGRIFLLQIARAQRLPAGFLKPDICALFAFASSARTAFGSAGVPPNADILVACGMLSRLSARLVARTNSELSRTAMFHGTMH